MKTSNIFFPGVTSYHYIALRTIKFLNSVLPSNTHCSILFWRLVFYRGSMFSNPFGQFCSNIAFFPALYEFPVKAGGNKDRLHIFFKMVLRNTQSICRWCFQVYCEPPWHSAWVERFLSQWLHKLAPFSLHPLFFSLVVYDGCREGPRY